MNTIKYTATVKNELTLFASVFHTFLLVLSKLFSNLPLLLLICKKEETVIIFRYIKVDEKELPGDNNSLCPVSQKTGHLILAHNFTKY